MNRFITLLVALVALLAVDRVFDVPSVIVGFAMVGVFAVILFRMWEEDAFGNKP